MFAGLIDEVRVFREQRSAADIAFWVSRTASVHDLPTLERFYPIRFDASQAGTAPEYFKDATGNSAGCYPSEVAAAEGHLMSWTTRAGVSAALTLNPPAPAVVAAPLPPQHAASGTPPAPKEAPAPAPAPVYDDCEGVMPLRSAFSFSALSMPAAASRSPRRRGRV